jgi:uncharacterized protein with HEPN domain
MCIDRVVSYTGLDRDRFFGSTLIQDAVIRNLQTLAESSQRLSDAIRNTESTIAWRQIAGFRNVLVHNYLGVDLDAVWTIVRDELPVLAAAVDRMRQRIANE